MKIGIYTPYLDSFGGGERYMLTIAEILSRKNDVDLLLDKHHLALDPKKLVANLAEHLDLDLSKVNLRQAPMGGGLDFFRRLLFWRNYDLLVYLTDGSIFYSTAKRSVVHFQVPFPNLAARGFLGRIKLGSWNLAICNSEFTKSHITKEWPIKGEVIYPPVEVEKIKPLRKKKQILSVGRFISFTKAKKHEEMIKAFSELYQNKKIDGWSLHLAGSVEGDDGYLDELKGLAGEMPIVFYPDCSFDELVKLYCESSIYWHAAGFGEEDPAKMEHFGITTVEAMAGGLVPVVINLGGQKEIVEDGVTGYLWDEIEQLKGFTVKLIENDKLREKLALAAYKSAKRFSKAKFVEKVESLVYEP